MRLTGNTASVLRLVRMADMVVMFDVDVDIGWRGGFAVEESELRQNIEMVI